MTQTLSPNFLRFMRTLQKAGKKIICDFCYQEVPEVHPYPKDPMVGDICTKCAGELNSFHKDEPTAQPRKQFVSKHAEGTPARVKEAGVIGAVHDLIFMSEKISLVKLRGEMEDKGYKSGTVSAQLARVAKAYIVKDGFVYADQKALTENVPTAREGQKLKTPSEGTSETSLKVKSTSKDLSPTLTEDDMKTKKAEKKKAGPSKCERLQEWFKAHKDSTPEQRQAYGKQLGLAPATVNTQFSRFNKGE